MMSQMWTSALDLAKKIRLGEVSTQDVVDQTLETIRRVDPNIGAFLTTLEPFSQIASIDEKRRNGTLSVLAGVPIALKDNLCLKGTRTTAGSRMLEHYVSPYTATAVDRLLCSDLIPIGKTNMDEFAMGSSTENSAFQKTRNPHDLERVPGGTSGGSAAAVASGMVPLALGTDTGGSVRQPAALTGILGFKPTYGRISRYGVIATASSLDQVGGFARSTTDLAALMDVVCGFDPKDATCLDAPAQFSAACSGSLRGKRFAFVKESLGQGNSAGVQVALDRFRDVLESAGAIFSEVSIPELEYALATYYIINTAEISSNLARYGGTVYGSHVQGDNWNDSIEKTRGQMFGPEVKRRILMGTYALSSGYWDAFYAKALRVRQKIAEGFSKAFEHADILVTPTSPIPAWRFGELPDDPLAHYRMDIDTVGVSLAGLPALSIPAGFEENDGVELPIGIQLIAPILRDESLFTASEVFEIESDRTFIRQPKMFGSKTNGVANGS